MRLNSTLESLESGELVKMSPKSDYSTMRESPESPDEQKQEEDNNRSNSGVFIVEGHCAPSPKSITSAVIADYLEQDSREDASSNFVTPPGPLKRVNPQLISPLNDLEAKETTSVNFGKNSSYEHFQCQPFKFRQPGTAVRDCGHGCTAKLTKMYFGY